MKKVVGMVVLMMLTTTVIPVTGVIEEKHHYDANLFNTQKAISNNVYRSGPSNINDELDQYYTNHAYALNIGNSTGKLAQTFTPTYPTITRLEIKLEKESGPTDFSSYKVRLNSGVPGGTVAQIYQTSFNSTILNTGANWYEFDILDQRILPGATYHIEIYGITPTTYTTTLRWCYGVDKPYTNGDAYYYFNSEWNILQEMGAPCDFCFKTYGTDFGGNHPPNIPRTPSGPSIGIIGTTYSYSTSTTDPDGDDVYYLFNWGDESTSFIHGPYVSGAACNVSNIWYEAGSYEIKVKSIDEHGRESGWSDPLSVTIPKSKATVNPLLFQLLEKFQDRFPLLTRLLDL